MSKIRTAPAQPPQDTRVLVEKFMQMKSQRHRNWHRRKWDHSIRDGTLDWGWWEDSEEVGSIGFGPRSEVCPFPETIQLNYGNKLLRPVAESLHTVPWAGGNKLNIGQVLCEAFWIQSGKRQEVDPRYIVTRMLDQLKTEFGYRCMSAFEYEFFLFDKDSQKPVFEGQDIYATYLISEFEEFLCTMDQQLTSTGVNIEHILSEYESGQFEMPTVPDFGLKPLDRGFLLKEGVKEISRQKGYEAVFMTNPTLTGSANGLHYNHSLWDDKGENAFYDPSSPDNMSTTFRHWIGGLFKHINALNAICSPTVNCYRRLYKPWAPDRQNWGIEDRMASVRAKNYDKSGTYCENRLPSGSCNPYLAVAATLAAGMDGLRNKIEPPPPLDPDAPKLLGSLKESLEHLEKDEVLKEAFGETFINWFLTEKRTVEISKVEACATEEAKLEAERYLYWRFC